VKPLIVMGLLGALRYRKRVSLETGLALAQISEFSLSLGALGLRVGHLDEETTSLLTAVALVTIAVSVYVYPHAGAIAEGLGTRLDLFERRVPRTEPDEAPVVIPDVIVLGLGRYGAGSSRDCGAGVRACSASISIRSRSPAGLTTTSTSSTATQRIPSFPTCCRCLRTDGS
jgi:Kef-type K+ transport system membrane component KefB